MKQIKNNYKRGFTLIELLVVISIISLLSSIVLSSVQDARNKAKISKFAQETQNLITAIELYRAGHDGEYPTSMSTGVIPVSNVLIELNSLTLFGSNTIDLPNGLSDFNFYPVDDGETTYTCGSENSSGGEWIIYVLSSNTNIPGYLPLYGNGSEDGDYKCIEI